MPVRFTFQIQFFPGEKVYISQADPLKISRLVGFDEGNQGLVQLAGKILPAGVAGAGQGKELSRQIHSPIAVGGNELVIGHRLLFGNGHISGSAFQLGRGHFLPGAVLGEFIPDGFLKIRRGLDGDFQNLRKTKLTDDFCNLIVLIDTTVFDGEHKAYPRFASFLYYIMFILDSQGVGEKRATLAQFQIL